MPADAAAAIITPVQNPTQRRAVPLPYFHSTPRPVMPRSKVPAPRKEQDCLPSVNIPVEEEKPQRHEYLRLTAKALRSLPNARCTLSPHPDDPWTTHWRDKFRNSWRYQLESWIEGVDRLNDTGRDQSSFSDRSPSAPYWIAVTEQQASETQQDDDCRATCSDDDNDERSRQDPPEKPRTYGDLVEDPLTIQHSWQKYIVPLVAKNMHEWVDGEYSVSLHAAGLDIGKKVINIMTPREVDAASCGSIQKEVLHALPSYFRATTTVKFTNGAIACSSPKAPRRSTRGTGPKSRDLVCEPRNKVYHGEAMMGDSIGSMKTKEPYGGTLGPQLTNGTEGYWLVNFHVLNDVRGDYDKVDLCHPSYDDFDISLDRLGYLRAWSGEAYKTTRISKKWAAIGGPCDRVVTDWALCLKTRLQHNAPRMRTVDESGYSFITLAGLASDVVPGREICSTGRTSGFSQGVIAMAPAIVLGKDGESNGKFHFGNDTGVPTLEWFIEKLNDEVEDHWIASCIGVPGDSGAGIVDSQTRLLYGQVWGRNQYYDVDGQANPRTTYFTAMHDILDDVEERYPNIGRLDLPVQAPVAIRTSVEPVGSFAILRDLIVEDYRGPISYPAGTPGLETPVSPPSRSHGLAPRAGVVEQPMRSRALPDKSTSLREQIKHLLQEYSVLLERPGTVSPAIPPPPRKGTTTSIVSTVVA
ncbi:hypothetical protein BJ170DRAFT_677515 [Xylariales sp. AK1849]|nr:hypothetical protein BJ170DRAFT_677515 [Xylariales sp. AK1849]